MRKIVFILFIFQAFLAVSQPKETGVKKNGYIKKKDERNKLVYEGEFKDDKPVGKFKYYYPNDSVRAIMFFKPDGKVYAKLFHPNGKRMAEGKYSTKEIKDSIWMYYDDGGVLISKEKYSLGKKDGTSYVYYPDGAVSEERNYKMDVQHGPFKQYFNDKAVKGQGNYINGKLEGRAAYYYPNGTEVAAGFYKNDVKTGPWIYREENGKVKEKELYKNGKLASKKETDAFFAKSKATLETTKQETKNPGAKKPEVKQGTKR